MIRKRRNLELDSLSAFDPPIAVHRPENIAGPLILSSPHSGRIYPDSFLERSNLSLNRLRQNEDSYIDEMLGFSRYLDIPLLSALFPRCFVDVNRDAGEIPARWQNDNAELSTARAEMGLGVIPTIIAENMSIYKKGLKADCVEGRISQLYRPYHDTLKTLISDAQSKFGRALLLDVHSMPGFTHMGQRRADIVLGDRHGTSCQANTISKVERLFLERGDAVTRNHPYAGGYVTSHYGQPELGVEVIQIEINRDLYLNPINYHRKSGYARLSGDLRAICFELLAERAEIPLAAE